MAGLILWFYGRFYDVLCLVRTATDAQVVDIDGRCSVVARIVHSGECVLITRVLLLLLFLII